MQSGIVKFYSDLQGIGFITPNSGGPEIFVNASALEKSGLSSLEKGQKVRFDLSEGRRAQLAASNLRLA